MGCDEHLYIEAKINGEWQAVNPPKPDDTEDFDHWGWAWRYQGDEYANPIPEWNLGRSYATYARLAGVRNYNEVEPIAPDRGIPADVTPEVRACHKAEEGDAHSATWFYLTEIEGEDDRIGELADEMRRVATEHGIPHAHVRAVVWFDN